MDPAAVTASASQAPGGNAGSRSPAARSGPAEASTAASRLPASPPAAVATRHRMTASAAFSRASWARAVPREASRADSPSRWSAR